MNLDTGAILLVDKAPGWTSHDAAAYLRGVLKVKTGHSGTLDPMATGLLIILLGRATKQQESYQKQPKTYRAAVTLGAQTDTWDCAGQVVKTAPVPPLTLEAVQKALDSMTGEISHPVPYYSAKKVDGVAMYKQARGGVNIVKESTVTIYGWDNISLQDNIVNFDVSCSSGTYVRSLAYMLGLKLGTLGHISALRRLSIGGESVDKAVPIDALKKMSKEEILKCVKIL